MKNQLILFAVLLSLVGAPVSAESNGGASALDILIVRPLALAGSLVSTGHFLGTLPLTAATGISHEAAYVMVAAPERFTAGRHISEWDRYRDGRDIRGWALETQQRRIDLELVDQCVGKDTQLAREH